MFLLYTLDIYIQKKVKGPSTVHLVHVNLVHIRILGHQSLLHVSL